MTVSCLVNRFDHIEIATLDLSGLEKLFVDLGFSTTQIRETPKLIQKLMVQGQTRMLLSQGRAGTFAFDYATKHGDGVCSIAYHTENVRETLKLALERGAKLAQDVTVDGHLKTAAIQSFGDVRASFVERSQYPAFDVLAPFAAGFSQIKVNDLSGVGCLTVDHLTNNVEMGTMDTWADFYKKTFGWIEARYFDIKAEKTGLLSKVMQSPDGATKIPINEASEVKSQVQEFIDIHKGAGVQHIALTTKDIRKTVATLKSRGFKFLSVPDTYYEAVPTRLKNLQEPIPELKALSILADGDDKGYLLQIFSENQIGPMFFEFIERHAHNGFGEGNFRALFEAIERDQIKRGVL